MLLQCKNRRCVESDNQNIIHIPYVYGVIHSKRTGLYSVYRGDVFIGNIRMAYGEYYQIKSKACVRWSKSGYEDIPSCIQAINYKIGG